MATKVEKVEVDKADIKAVVELLEDNYDSGEIADDIDDDGEANEEVNPEVRELYRRLKALVNQEYKRVKA